MKKLNLIGFAALVALLVAFASTATAASNKGGKGVVKTGKCSASSHWKLKAKSDDGRIETEFEVDQNRVGKRWRVTIARNGANVFRGIRTTVAPSGSFSVRRLLAGPPSRTRIVATAKALHERRDVPRRPLPLAHPDPPRRSETGGPVSGLAASTRDRAPAPRARPACGR